ncbi:hypothetical protein MRX96_014410 [Rhipicephalus microplus]
MIRSCSVLLERHRFGFCSAVLFPYWCARAIGQQVPKSALRTPLRLAMDLTAIANPASCDALPLSRGLPTSALRAAWIPRCVLYHLPCANAKLEWRIPQPPLQSDYRQLQAQGGILLLQRLETRRSGAQAGQECRTIGSSPSISKEGPLMHQMASVEIVLPDERSNDPSRLDGGGPS